MNHFYKIVTILATLVLAGAFAFTIDKSSNNPHNYLSSITTTYN